VSKEFSILIDCTSLVVGGGIQAGLSALRFAVDEPQLRVHLACSSLFWAEVPPVVRARIASTLINSTRNRWERFRFASRVSKYERFIVPKVTFTVFGPAYWTPTRPRLQGFAVPRLIYPEIRIPIHDRFLGAPSDWVETRLKTAYLRRSKMDLFVVETATVKRRLAKHALVPESRISIIGNTVSPMFFEHSNPQVMRGPTPPYNVLVPSSYYPHKNLEFIPRVANALRSMLPDHFVFTFCIPLQSHGWARIERVTKDLQVGSHIRTIGQVPHHEFHRLYAGADVVFLPTLLECSSAVYPESFASARPLVTTDADFSRELCGNAALYCSTTDPRDAATKILVALTNLEVRERLVESGKAQLAQTYTTPELKWHKQLGLLQELGGNC